jgi:hypothetical protein
MIDALLVVAAAGITFGIIYLVVPNGNAQVATKQTQKKEGK